MTSCPKYLLRRSLITSLASLKIQKVTPSQLQEFINTKTHLANSYIDKITSSRNMYQDSCKTLIDEGFLLKVAQEKENRLPMLYGGTDK